MIMIRLIIILIFLQTIRGQSTPCDLPDGRKSTCMRLHLCNHFQNMVRLHNGRPPQDVVDDIRRHGCINAPGNICCPDNAVAATSSPPLPISLSPNNIVNYEELKNHPNINLINDRRCGQATTDKIVGGFDAKINEVTWLALLGYKLIDDTITWSCGGALITTRYVVTASHCNLRTLTLVRLGEHTISQDKDCDDLGLCADGIQDIGVEKFIKHPQFDRIKKRNDIALIRLAAPADTSRNNIETICLPVEKENDIENVITATKFPLTISGFGKLGNGVQTDVLQKAYVPFVSNADCVKRYQADNVPIHPEYLCAGGRNKTDTCRGDSGGPIYTVGRTKPRLFLYGVVIGGIDCGNPNLIYPGIYSDVRFYLKWILDNIRP